MANFCSWCGSPLEPGARYCPECGARVLESVKVDGSADAVDPMRGFDIVDGEEEPDPLNQRFGGQPPEAVDTSGPEGPLRYCPYCGAKLGDSYTFCGHCGKRLPDVQEEDHP